MEIWNGGEATQHRFERVYMFVRDSISSTTSAHQTQTADKPASEMVKVSDEPFLDKDLKRLRESTVMAALRNDPGMERIRRAR